MCVCVCFFRILLYYSTILYNRLFPGLPGFPSRLPDCKPAKPAACIITTKLTHHNIEFNIFFFAKTINNIHIHNPVVIITNRGSGNISVIQTYTNVISTFPKNQNNTIYIYKSKIKLPKQWHKLHP